MHMIKSQMSKILTALVLSLMTAGALAAELPRLQFAIGEVSAVDLDGKSRSLKKGDALSPGEKLITGPDAMVQLRIFKQGVVVLRDDSQLELKPEVNGRYGVALDRGLMRTVTKLAYKLGKIDVLTPAGDIEVQAGDALTAVGSSDNDKTTHNQVFNGEVKITTANQQQLAKIGEVVQMKPGNGLIKAVAVAPAGLQLRVPAPRQTTKPSFGKVLGKGGKQAYQSDITKLEVLKPGVGRTKKPGKVNAANTIAALSPSGQSRVVKVNYDGAKVIDPRISVGSAADQQVVNSSLLVSIPSSIGKESTVVPVATSKPKIRKNLASQAQIVRLNPIKSIGGETTLGSSSIPNVKVVTYEPTKVMNTNPAFNPVLANTIKNNSGNVRNNNTIKCPRCTKTLTLIKP